MSRVVRVAALQAAAVLLNRDATLDRLDTWARPNGRYLAGPVYDEETLVAAECDLGEITRESLTLDVSGHYSRPDIFTFKVRPWG